MAPTRPTEGNAGSSEARRRVLGNMFAAFGPRDLNEDGLPLTQGRPFLFPR
jgi:hypothetical protein